MNEIHQIQTWLIKRTQDIVNMYNIEGHQKKPKAYLAGSKTTTYGAELSWLKQQVHYMVLNSVDWNNK